MTRSKTLSFLPILLLTVLSLAACSGPFKGGTGPCTVNCPTGGGGGNTLSLIMVSELLPPHPSILTFKVTIAGIALINSAGTQQALTLKGSPVVELMHLQTDSAFLGTFTNIPTGNYTGVVVSFSNPVITFLNDTGSTLQNCAPGAVCTQFSPVNSGRQQSNLNFSISSTTATGLGLVLELGHIAIVSGSNLSVNLANPQVLFAFKLPRSTFSLAPGQLDIIEDFTGVVNVSGGAVTITSAAVTSRGALSATANANTIFNTDPSGTLCKNPSTANASSCVSNNQAASMDVLLKSDGTLAIQEIEPLLATLQDTAEGIIVAINSSNTTQFTMVVTDIIPAATGSLIGSLQIGDGLIVNLTTSPTFFVDTKGLTVPPSVLNNFFTQNNTAAMHLGQVVAVHVPAFTAATTNTFASANNVDTATLRWSRLTATPSAPGSPAFNITGLPAYFGFPSTSSTAFQVQTTPGTPGTRGVTNFDGLLDGTSINAARPINIRALYLENIAITAQPAFTSAKVRQY
jgi:hypothetical protein